MGIYGDFLFSKANRFGGGLETMLGPVASEAWRLGKMGWDIRDVVTGDDKSKMPAGDALNFVYDNTPFLNLFYVRPTLDFLILNSIKEAVSPGYLKRQKTNRKKDYGQTPWHAQAL